MKNLTVRREEVCNWWYWKESAELLQYPTLNGIIVVKRKQGGEEMIAQLDTKTVYSFMESLVSIEKYLQMSKE